MEILHPCGLDESSLSIERVNDMLYIYENVLREPTLIQIFTFFL